MSANLRSRSVILECDCAHRSQVRLWAALALWAPLNWAALIKALADRYIYWRPKSFWSYFIEKPWKYMKTNDDFKFSKLVIILKQLRYGNECVNCQKNEWKICKSFCFHSLNEFVFFKELIIINAYCFLILLLINNI